MRRVILVAVAAALLLAALAGGQTASAAKPTTTTGPTTTTAPPVPRLGVPHVVSFTTSDPAVVNTAVVVGCPAGEVALSQSVAGANANGLIAESGFLFRHIARPIGSAPPTGYEFRTDAGFSSQLAAVTFYVTCAPVA